jgi:hypothetical protein
MPFSEALRFSIRRVSPCIGVEEHARGARVLENSSYEPITIVQVQDTVSWTEVKSGSSLRLRVLSEHSRMLQL